MMLVMGRQQFGHNTDYSLLFDIEKLNFRGMYFEFASKDCHPAQGKFLPEKAAADQRLLVPFDQLWYFPFLIFESF